jgi:hypothetical protein
LRGNGNGRIIFDNAAIKSTEAIALETKIIKTQRKRLLEIPDSENRRKSIALSTEANQSSANESKPNELQRFPSSAAIVVKKKHNPKFPWIALRALSPHICGSDITSFFEGISLSSLENCYAVFTSSPASLLNSSPQPACESVFSLHTSSSSNSKESLSQKHAHKHNDLPNVDIYVSFLNEAAMKSALLRNGEPLKLSYAAADIQNNITNITMACPSEVFWAQGVGHRLDISKSVYECHQGSIASLNKVCLSHSRSRAVAHVHDDQTHHLLSLSLQSYISSLLPKELCKKWNKFALFLDASLPENSCHSYKYVLGDYGYLRSEIDTWPLLENFSGCAVDHWLSSHGGIRYDGNAISPSTPSSSSTYEDMSDVMGIIEYLQWLWSEFNCANSTVDIANKFRIQNWDLVKVTDSHLPTISLHTIGVEDTLLRLLRALNCLYKFLSYEDLNR